MGVNYFFETFFSVFSSSFIISFYVPFMSYTKFLFTFHYTIYFHFVKRYYYLLLFLTRTYKYTCYCLYCLAPCVFLSYSIHFATLHSFHNPETPHFIGAIRLSEKTSFSSSIYYLFAQSDTETTWTSYIVLSFPYLSIVICFLSILKTVPISSINSPSPALCFELLSCKSFPAMLLK